ncbi:hypothetical protein Ahu01nite_002650 [Winogradskya humida]|uniref:Uncharacterized protein n=1 Tax=Winogradskya humida TaxID=113566 RepID=A0ABQ3ZF04_9ACTN|nr:hypothetical protein Ahu01nite_002650 [Actinoplanes humidus]
MADILERAARLAERPTINFTVLVPIVSGVSVTRGAGLFPTENWLDARATSDWLACWVPSVPRQRQYGSLMIELQARDSFSGVERAATLDLGSALRSAPDNVDRARILKDAIRSGTPPLFAHTRYWLGVERMKKACC